MEWLRVSALVSLVLAWALPVCAQQSIEYGSISGRVIDQSRANVPGAQVSARHLQTNVTATSATDSAGRFRFPYLKVGHYEVIVRLQGFNDWNGVLALSAASAFELPVVLSITAVDASVTVNGEASVLEAARSQIAATVGEIEARTLPLNGRNFLELGLLVPGVSPANVGSTQLFPETSAVAGVSLSVGSQRNLSNNFIVDGLSANDDAAALSGIAYGVDAVEQLQVVTSGAQAELGRALGGYVNVVTKSGTNELHGTGYLYLRDDELSAANALSGRTLPMHQTQYGGSVGGPLLTDRTFYFTNVERRDLDQTGLTTISVGNAAAINARLAAVGYRGPLVATGEFPSPADTTNLLAKLDHQVSGRDQLSVRYALYDVAARNARGAGGLSAPSASSALANLDQTFAVGNTLMLSSRTVLETRGQLAYANLEAPPTDPAGPAVTIAGVATFGTLSTSPTARANRMIQIVNNLSHQAGAHALRAGIDLLFNDDRITFPRAARGAYTFSSLGNFLSGTYNNAGFTQTFGATDVSQGNSNAGVYAQDEWKPGSRLTLNLGVRYDLQFLDTIRTDADNVSPRIGVVWSPGQSRRTIVRGNAGVYFDRVPLRAVANALLSAGNTTVLSSLRQIGVSLSPAQAAAPVFPNVLGGPVPSVTLPNLTTMDRRLRNAYSRQASAEVEQQVGARATVSVGYHYLRGTGLLMAINQNVPSCVPSGANNGCRPNPEYANDSQYSSAGDSNYHGLHVSFTQRPARWGHYRVSYTLSRSMNNVGEFFFSSPIDPFDLSKDWGRSDDDQRHRLVVSGAVETHGFQVSGMLQTYSALPFNILSGVTTIQGTPGRPVVDGEFIERNAGSSSAFFSLNLRVSRAFRLSGRLRLEGMVEGFNVTNHTNVVTRNAVFGTGPYPTNPLPAFGQATAVGEPRSFQVSARVRF